MKSTRLALFHASTTTMHDLVTYTLPGPESITDFYSTSDFTLLVSSSGELYEIGSFIRNSLNSSECHPLDLNLSILSLSCNNECTLFLSKSGRIHAWGISNTGILNNSHTFPIPSHLSNFELKKICKISIANTYAGCIDDQGSVYIWGSFQFNKLNHSTSKFTDYKDFVAKEISCSDTFFCICTDGGFAYFIGKIGNHWKKDYLEISTFPELEELCVVNIACGLGFIAVLTDLHEVFLFDGCCVLSKLPCVGRVHQIMACWDCVVGIAGNFVNVWREDNESIEKFTKNYCPLKYWLGKAFAFDEDCEVLSGKAMPHRFGLLYRCENDKKIVKSIVKEHPGGWNRGNFAKIIENDSSSSALFAKNLLNATQSILFEYFSIIFKYSKQQTLMDQMIMHGLLPNTLANVYANYYRRSLMIGIICIKSEIKMQDFLARERVKMLRMNNKAKLDGCNLLFTYISQANCRAFYQKLCFAYGKIMENLKFLKCKQQKIRIFAAVLRKGTLRNYLKKWGKICADKDSACKSLLHSLKHIKHQKLSEAFSSIRYYSTWAQCKSLKKIHKFSVVLNCLDLKEFRACFKRWKNIFLVAKAETQRDYRNYQLSVKLGCKYLIPVLLPYISSHWGDFKANAFHEVKSKYKHFALFIVYFMKKKVNNYGFSLFGKISPTVPTPDISSNYSNLMLSPKEDSEFLNSSMISSLNLLLASHKKLLNSSAMSPRVPTLEFNFTPKKNSKFSSSQSTIRPPWKPASGSNSRTTTPKSSKQSHTKQNKCLRSLNILPKAKLIKKKNSLCKPTDIKIKLTLAVNILKRMTEKIEFKLKFFALNLVRFH